MKKFIKLDSEGVYVSIVGTGLVVPTGFREIDIRISDEDCAALYMVDGDLEVRPQIEQPSFNGSVFGLPNCPVGTAIEVVDVVGGEIILDHEVEGPDLTVNLTLPDAGTYQITVTPPLPFMPVWHLIEV